MITPPEYRRGPTLVPKRVGCTRTQVGEEGGPVVFLVMLVIAVAVVVLVMRAAAVSGGGAGGAGGRGGTRTPRPPRGPKPPQRVVAPDDDPDFLRELDRRTRRDDGTTSA